MTVGEKTRKTRSNQCTPVFRVSLSKKLELTTSRSGGLLAVHVTTKLLFCTAMYAFLHNSSSQVSADPLEDTDNP